MKTHRIEVPLVFTLEVRPSSCSLLPCVLFVPVAEGSKLLLLYVMCAIAPLIKLVAGSTVDPESKHNGVQAR